MSSSAQTLANRANAQHSTGPVTSEGKSRCSRNAITSGLFSKTDYVSQDESEIYAEFCSAYEADLLPHGAIEHTLAAEIVHAAWRLRRCSELEETSNPAEAAAYEKLQTSIERARSAAHRVFQRSLNELRRTQTERLMREKLAGGTGAKQELGVASCKEIEAFLKPTAASMEAAFEQLLAVPRRRDFAKQTQSLENTPPPQITKQSQSAAETPSLIARSAPCPCGSGLKYKRCCGKNAPAVHHLAA